MAGDATPPCSIAAPCPWHGAQYSHHMGITAHLVSLFNASTGVATVLKRTSQVGALPFLGVFGRILVAVLRELSLLPLCGLSGKARTLERTCLVLIIVDSIDVYIIL